MVKRKDEKRFIVYRHLNAQTGVVFYIGIGTKGREKQKYKRSDRWKRYVEKYGFKHEIVRESLTWMEACNEEKDLIKRIGRQDNCAGTLINMTDGGDGTGGYEGFWKGKKRPPASAETIEKCRKNSTKPFLGRKHSKETRTVIKEKRAAQDTSYQNGKPLACSGWNRGVKMWEGKIHPRGMQGKKMPLENRLKRSEMMKKRHLENPVTQETKNKIKSTRLMNGGYGFTDEVKIKISEGVKKYYANRKK